MQSRHIIVFCNQVYLVQTYYADVVKFRYGIVIQSILSQSIYQNIYFIFVRMVSIIMIASI